MDRSIRLGLAITAVVALVAATAWAFPKPSPVPVDWEVDFKFQDLRRIRVAVPGEKEQIYWYMVYTLTNNTGQDVVFLPEFTLVTDTLQVLPAMVNVEPEVLTAIKEQYGPTYPWMEHPSQLIGRILQGQDNARDSVAIWPDFDPKATTIDIFVGGLAGETIAIPNPAYRGDDEDQANGSPQFVLRKTLQIRYTLPADSANRNRVNAFRSVETPLEWVMR